MIESKYTLKLTGTVTDGKYTQSFTEKNVDHIEFSFGDKKIEIGKKSLEREIHQLKTALKQSMDHVDRVLPIAEKQKEKLEKIQKLHDNIDVFECEATTLDIVNELKAILDGNNG